MATPTPDASPPLLRLWRTLRGHRPRIVAAAACSVLNKLFDLAPPVLIGMAVDVVVRREVSFLAGFGVADPRGQVAVLAGLTVVIWGLESLFEYLYAWLWRNLAQTVQHELRVAAWDHVLHLEAAAFEDRRTGDLLAVLNDDVNQLERFLDVGANEILQVATTVLVIGAGFLWLSPLVGALAMLPMPVVLWGSFRFQRRIAPRYAAVRRQAGRIAALLADALAGLETIKAFTAEARERARLERESAAYRRVNAEAIRLSAAFVPLIRMAIVVGFTFTLVVGGLQALDGRLEVGAYSVMVFMTQRLLWPLTRLGNTFDLYQRAMASTERILDLLAVPIGIRGGHRRLERVAGEVRFEGVRFAYPGRPPVFEGLDLEIPAGRTVAVVGPTGAGKTSLVRLLLRFREPQAGRVLLDGVPVEELDLAFLRRQVGLVSQSTFLFPGSVRDNVAYGRPDADDRAVEAALRAAEAWDFVQALPEGLDTDVGEWGQRLSGGQRQRLALARAILLDPPILVLDEATSSVDNETEAAIQRSLAQLGRGRTVLVIAHRLSTVRHADAIHVLEGGRIVESGTHEALLARGGRYAALWSVQTGQAA